MFEVLSGCNVIGYGIFGSMASNSEPPQSPNYDNIEMEGIGSLTLPNSLKAPFEKFELSGNSKQGENPSPENPQEIKNSGKYDEVSGKYVINVSITGKNLIPFPYPKLGGVGTTVTRNGITYTVLEDRGIKITGKAIKTVFVNLLQNFELTNNKKYVYSDGLKSDPNNGLIFYSVIEGNSINKTYYPQIEHGNVATDYEPYKEPQTITLLIDNKLKGIPVRYGGNYTDQSGQQWIIDEIDLVKGKYIKRINSVMIDGNDLRFSDSGTGFWNTKFFSAVNGIEKTDVYMSEYFSKEAFGLNGTYEFIFTTPKQMENYFKTAEELNEFCVRKYNEGKPLIIYYVTKPIETNLPQEMQLALENLHANDGTTIVSVDSGEVETGIKLTYRKEK